MSNLTLQSVKICGFRAFSPNQPQEIEFDGANTVVEGDNGTGKSSILSAIEFLISGRISHLRGEGTDGINIYSHATHVNAEPSECWVEGSFCTNNGRRGRFRRTAESASNLRKVSGEIATDEIAVEASVGDHILFSRGELLEFIESTNTERGNTLHSLLRLSRIDNRESGFEKVQKRVIEEKERVEKECYRRRAELREILDLERLETPIQDDGAILEEVNRRRQKLKAENLSAVSQLDKATKGVKTPEKLGEEVGFSEARLRAAVDGVDEYISKKAPDLIERLETTIELLAELEGREDALGQMQQFELFRSADSIIDANTSTCPLCQAEHQPKYLKKHLTDQLEELEDVKRLKKRLEENQSDIRQSLQEYQSRISNLEEVIQGNESAQEHLETDLFSGISYKVDELLSEFDDDLTEGDGRRELINTYKSGDFKQALIGEAVVSTISDIQAYVDRIQPRDSFIEAYNELKDVETVFDEINRVTQDIKRLTTRVQESEQVLNLFTAAKEDVIEGLYEAIEDDFESYYSYLHPDEEDITISLDRDANGGVDITVSFYGQGTDKPLAFHSEGHLDTMGIALFLSLWKHRKGQGPNLLLLDDIVMSIDRRHRQRISKLIKQFIPTETQVIITTHDEVWANKLVQDSVVTKDNVVSILDCNLEIGPALKGTGTQGAVWDIIEERLDEGDTRGAAVHLRRGAEKISAQSCTRLQGEVAYGRDYTLSDYTDAIQSRLNDLTSGVMGRSDQNEGDEMFEAAQNLDKQRKKLLENDMKREMNKTIHYEDSEWSALTEPELREVSNHWQQIEDLLYCDECESFYSYSRKGDWRILDCKCGKINLRYEK
jgi:DNA repair exonuclease SbcCD ATPase subunit